MDTILEIIEKIQKQKTNAKKEPNHATSKEIRREFSAQLEMELQLLIEDGLQMKRHYIKSTITPQNTQ